MVVDSEHITNAFEHFTVIADLHGDNEPHDQFEAVRTYMEYLGLDDEAITELINQTQTFVPDGLTRAYGWVIMGFLMGLTAAQRSSQPV